MLHNTVLKDITNNYKDVAKLHEQGSSGKIVQYPSDNAIVATRASNIGTKLREIEQYQRNASSVNTYIEAYDSVTEEMSSLSYRLRELVVNGANDTLTESDRKVIAQEIDQIREHFIQLANTSITGDYIFAGAESKTQPVNADGTISMTAEANMSKIVDLGRYDFEYNFTVYDAFTVDGNESIFNLLSDISENLQSDNPDEYLNTTGLEKLDRYETKIQDLIAQNGANGSFVEMATNRFDEYSTFMTEYLSKEQDADFLEVYTNLSNLEAVLQASMKTGGSVMMYSLVDYVNT
jgi:flagellar hook-associated protein 3 FlgL